MSFLQIASWNIEHLGGSSRAEKRQSAFALADHIEMSGIDIIALQEIYVTPFAAEVRLGDGQPVIATRAVGERRNADLDIVCYLLEEHLEDPWQYQILPNRSATDDSQLCAVMWNSKRATLEAVVSLDVAHKVDGLNLWDRKPHVMNFMTEVETWRKDAAGAWTKVAEQRRLSLISLHMKSNYGGVTQNRRVRGLEAETLCAALAARSAEIDESLVLVGDTNILNNAEPAIETFIANGFIDLNNTDSHTYWSPNYPGAPFDRVFVRKDRPEFRYSRQYVMKSADLLAHDRFLSDHYMIKFSVKDYVDDADPR